MSSILKALKKLEQDKAVRRPDTLRIDADILRGGVPRRTSSTGVLLAVIVIFVCGAAVTYVSMKLDIRPALEKTSRISINESKGEPAATVVGLPVSVDPAVGPTLRKVEQTPSRPEHSIPVSRKSPYPPRQMERLQQPQKANPAGVAAQIVPINIPKPPPAAVSTPVTTVLKVDGIAFQDGADSMAVINGIMVSKGSLIEGVRVEEIQKDRVKLNRGGEKFELFLDKSN